MTLVTLPKKELEKKIGKVSKEVEDKISMFGTPVEENTDESFVYEVFPNRPDLLSLQGFSRIMNCYLNGKKLPEYKINKPEKNYKVTIEKNAKKATPYAACAIVKNLKLSDEKIKEIIDIQEKLHMTLGRKRKKMAVGIYPLDKIKLPLTFTAKKPEDIKFIPLEFDKEINGRQILSKHPAGREYAPLLKDYELFPVWIDGANKVLSMPPVINSHETGKITETTKDIFIECTGQNLPILKKTINILVAAFADMGGEIYSLEVEDEKEGKSISPNFEAEKMPFKIEDINKTLGLNLEEKQVKQLLEKMGIGYEAGKAIIPAFRTDILHWVDLAEEIGIAYGYENFKPEIPKISTIAQEDPLAIKKRLISQVLAGLNFLECSSYHLSTKEDIKKVHPDFKEFIELEDSKTEYNVLRKDLITNLMKILSENSDSSYPQKIFELGRVFSLGDTETGIKERNKLGCLIADENSNFTVAKQTLDYLFKMLGKTYELKEFEHPALITGRAAIIILDKKEIGILGEISPRALKSFKLKMPVSAFELDLDF